MLWALTSQGVVVEKGLGVSDLRQLLEYARQRAREARSNATGARTLAEESDWTHTAATWEAMVTAYEGELSKKNANRSDNP